MVLRLPEGEMVSQFVLPFDTDALAVKLVAVAAVTDRVCDGGAAPFKVALKVSDVGLTDSLPPPSCSASPILAAPAGEPRWAIATEVQTALEIRAADVTIARQ